MKVGPEGWMVLRWEEKKEKMTCDVERVAMREGQTRQGGVKKKKREEKKEGQKRRGGERQEKKRKEECLHCDSEGAWKRKKKGRERKIRRGGDYCCYL